MPRASRTGATARTSTSRTQTRSAISSFGPRNHSPTDRAEHFAHANTAESLVSVWIAADDLSRERGLLRVLGATFSRTLVRVPDPLTAEVARLPEGDVVLLPARYQRVPGRRIVGATLRVRSLETAGTVLSKIGRRRPDPPPRCVEHLPSAVRHARALARVPRGG